MPSIGLIGGAGAWLPGGHSEGATSHSTSQLNNRMQSVVRCI
jgi:hypothetical protein